MSSKGPYPPIGTSACGLETWPIPHHSAHVAESGRARVTDHRSTPALLTRLDKAYHPCRSDKTQQPLALRLAMCALGMAGVLTRGPGRPGRSGRARAYTSTRGEGGQECDEP